MKQPRGWNVAPFRGRWAPQDRVPRSSGRLPRWCMQDVILDHLHEVDPRTKEQLAEDMAHDYGSFEDRTLLRNLSSLISMGLVIKEEEYSLLLGRMVPVYRRAGKVLPNQPEIPDDPIEQGLRDVRNNRASARRARAQSHGSRRPEAIESQPSHPRSGSRRAG